MIKRGLVTQAGETHYVKETDVTAVVEHCKALRQEGVELDLEGGLGRTVARVPRALIGEAAAEGINIFDMSEESSKWLFNKLNGEWKAFKLTKGHLANFSGHI